MVSAITTVKYLSMITLPLRYKLYDNNKTLFLAVIFCCVKSLDMQVFFCVALAIFQYLVYNEG